MTDSKLSSILKPVFDPKNRQTHHWGHLYGSSFGLIIQQTAMAHSGPVLVVTEDSASAQRLEDELRFYLKGSELPLLSFPDWETLPYDMFSPHQDIISDRLATLYQLPKLKQGILVVSIQTLMHRVSPQAFLDQHCLFLELGQQLDLDEMRLRLDNGGYRHVSSVIEHGEFTIRGSLLDLFPMGSQTPYRIELFDDEIETIRTFDPESQRTLEKTQQIRLLPAREFPIHKEAISKFRQAFRARFEGDPQQSIIYRDISNGNASPGIEYYLQLFFDELENLFSYLPQQTLLITVNGVEEASKGFWTDIQDRYEQHRHDIERPLLAPEYVFLNEEQLQLGFDGFTHIEIQHYAHEETERSINFNSLAPPQLTLDARAAEPADKLIHFMKEFEGRILFVAETTGRRETLLELLRGHHIQPKQFDSWQAFFQAGDSMGITVAPLEHGLILAEPNIAVIAEPQLFGQTVMQRRRRQRAQRDSDSIVRNLAELTPGAPVVHEEYGVGRYIGLQTLQTGELQTEFLTLEYAGGDKLYVPVASLHLISRYTGTTPETAPLHRLGSGQWEKARRRASERVRDVAAELLDIYAKREARQGFAYPYDEIQYRGFVANFPFEETPDQQDAIDAVVEDMRSSKPMDRLVCGDVGFGKTEVAMRAAFMAVMAGKQVAVLTPTTLLTQQHTDNFRDRFADWPVQVDSLSRFRSKKETDTNLKKLAEGKIDIVIGTHKLLQTDVKYKNLGLVIIDEEHRFGVRQKERFKSLRSEVDVLTLTATPIPRTLNMAVAGIRDLSIIASPPARRLAIKTFVSQWNDVLVREACLREIKRGGQVFFLHNEVDSIDKQVKKIQELIPEAEVHFAHGQMRERELEQIMSDFYHQRFNILVCTTIIETGIDIPSANTIIINRADRFGLAQLYQLRGRVGRSHHRAYAYLITPPKNVITADAKKRLEAIESIETLGTGFTLATHDLEIRGAGELLGDEQSGQMQEIGYTLYTELLERAVNALKEGKEPDLTTSSANMAEVDLHMPALIPEDYLYDVHERLIMYKRIASASSDEALRELQVEMIDRFGLLPDPIKALFQISSFKLQATELGIRKIDLGDSGGHVSFDPKPNIDPMLIIQLIQQQPNIYKLDQKNNKLRIAKNLDDRQERITLLEELLDYFQNQQAA
ncbi:MAG: transcription-repair coupling factor [Gammaproteobacteria bacterium]|nr:transcription-repair coupling factor [Gammaproteobacteria bacterium]